MNLVDNVDQLSNVYRCDHIWWRNRKPWWSQFMWLLRTVKVAAYKVYLFRCKETNTKPKSHLQFHQELVEQLLSAKSVSKKRKLPVEEPEKVSSHTRAAEAATIEPGTTAVIIMSEKSLRESPRLNGCFHPLKHVESSHKKMTKCQWCRYKWDKLGIRGEGASRITRAHIKCVTCKVNLCGADCYNDFHCRVVK